MIDYLYYRFYMDIVLIGRAAIDFNPNEIHRTLDKVRTFTMYVDRKSVV